MTTSKSPLWRLKDQANKIASRLKAAARGDNPSVDCSKENIKFAIAMDDKILTVEMLWETIRETSEAGLAEYILKQMRGASDPVN